MSTALYVLFIVLTVGSLPVIGGLLTVFACATAVCFLAEMTLGAGDPV